MEEKEDIISIQQWLIIIILSAIPFLNLILFIYWGAFPPLDINKNKQNYAVAMLVILGVVYALGFIGWFLGKM